MTIHQPSPRIQPEDRAYAAAQRRAATMPPSWGCVNPDCGNTHESALNIAYFGRDCRCCGGLMEPNP